MNIIIIIIIITIRSMLISIMMARMRRCSFPIFRPT